jgi:hypothetical protein
VKQNLKPYFISLPTLLLPGLSHFLLGKKKKALGFFFTVSLMFVLGILLSGGLFTIKSPNWLYKLAGIGELGMGAPYFICLLSGINSIVPETVTSVMFGYGSTFLIAAGLMNMLLMMDAFDIAAGRKVYD